MKGGGGAHTREKIVAAAAKRFVVIVSAEKEVAQAGTAGPARGAAVRGAANARGGRRRASCAAASASPDGNLIADYHGPVEDARGLAARLSETPGVVEHGLFAPEMVSEVLIAGADGIRRRAGGKSTS